MTSKGNGKGSIVDLRVSPNSKSFGLEFCQDFLRVRVIEPARDGAANTAVENVFKRIDPDARIVSGFKGRRKKLVLPNTDSESLERRLRELLE